MADRPTEPIAPRAQLKTDLAEDRTVLANERTFASWMRTGLAGIGIGLGFHALFTRMEPHWVPKLIATAFLLIAVLIFVSAERRASVVMARLHTHEVTTIKLRNIRVITIVTVIATLALIGVIWFLPTESGAEL